MSTGTDTHNDIHNPVFARLYHRLLSKEGRRMHALRGQVLEGLRGRVLEIGPGNGPNFDLYPASVSEVLAVEPEPYLRRRAGESAAGAPVAIRVVAGTASALPVEDGWADAVVCSLVLCSVPDQAEALREIRRALGERGELRLLEHVGANCRVAQAVLHGAEVTFWRRAFGNCHPTRDTLAALDAAGFDTSDLERRVMRASSTEPPLPYIFGTAR
jgi:SAM-dependent methyltransferase